MRAHVFGNSPSLAVAIYSLRKAALEEEKNFGKGARRFVERDFYVDDGLKSLLTAAAAAIDLLKRTKEMLACSSLRLHKIASNNEDVVAAFPTKDHANDLKDLDLGADTLPMQCSLGVSWNLRNNTFTFQVPDEKKPFTRRGVLLTVNSLYDPLGFIAPVTIQGKDILRTSQQTLLTGTHLCLQRKNIDGKCGEIPSKISKTWKSHGLMHKFLLLQPNAENFASSQMLLSRQ